MPAGAEARLREALQEYTAAFRGDGARGGPRANHGLVQQAEQLLTGLAGPAEQATAGERATERAGGSRGVPALTRARQAVGATTRAGDSALTPGQRAATLTGGGNEGAR